MIDPEYLKKVAADLAHFPKLELVAAADEIVALRSKLASAEKRVDELSARLELSVDVPGGHPMQIDIGEMDGIGCRNETIKLLQENGDRLRSRLDRARKWTNDALDHGSEEYDEIAAILNNL